MHPSSRPLPHSTPLSLIDNTSAGAPPPTGVWLWDQPSTERGRAALSVELLTRSLQTALDSCSFLCGQLAPIEYRPHDYRHRRGCMQLTWGQPTDPGAQLVIASCPLTLASLVPSMAERAQTGLFDASKLPLTELFPSTQLAMSGGADHRGLPVLTVQLTSFSCGGFGIGARLTHALSDAASLMAFMRQWADVNRALLDGSPLPATSLIYAAELLDRCAAGDLDAAEADPKLLETARAVCEHRFDWWASSAHCPPFMLANTKIPPEIDPASVGALGSAVPWLDWEWQKPCVHWLLDFSAAETEAMWKDARASAGGVPISHEDALVAHLWCELSRARGLHHRSKPIALTRGVGLRDRLQPPVPPTAIGSIRIMAPTMLSAQAVCSQPIGATAAALRSTVSSFTAESLPAVLHEFAHETTPQRRCQILLGHHCTSASWTRQGIAELDFGQSAQSLRYFDAVLSMPLDNAFYVFEAAGGGLTISLSLQAEYWESLVASPTLRKYRR